MRRLLYSLVWATVLFSVALGNPALARADGSTTSAGDQQYVDPLTTTSPATPPAPAAPAATTPSPTSSAPHPRHDPGRTLPYTGFDVRVLVAIGVGLIALGLVLRRTTRRRA